MINKNEKLRTAAGEFSGKASKLSTVLEIAIVGSVAGNDPYPNNLDLAVITRNLDEIKTIAKYARQISRHYPDWEVFVFSEKLAFLGFICFRKQCPGQSIDCAVPGCGEPPHRMVIPGFKYKEKTFFSSPIDILYTSYKASRFLWHKKELGITESREYPVLEDIELRCINCGETFIFSAQEQKIFQKRGFHPPKRCPDCIEQERIEGLRDW